MKQIDPRKKALLMARQIGNFKIHPLQMKMMEEIEKNKLEVTKLFLAPRFRHHGKTAARETLRKAGLL